MREAVRPFLRTRTLPFVLAAGLALAPLLPPHEAAARPVPDSFADLVEQVSPAVVQIVSRTEAVSSRSTGDEDSMDRSQRDLLERFFGQRMAPERQGPRMGLGSGFIVSSDGVIVTNNHVVGDADRIDVRLRDGREFKAELIGTDPQTDLAVLRIHADGPLPVLAWGNSDAARVGDWVVAVGNPYGLSGTVTAGIVSSRGRDTDASPYVDFLQIDAPLNSGNSGGPLLDSNGQVIGVNTAILSPNPNGGSVGIGFAIPSDTAKKIVADLRENGKVDRGWLGVAIQPVSPDIADSLGLKGAAGALVATVAPDSPAARSGVRQGDVILAIDGQKVATPRELSRAVADTKTGTRTVLTVWRGDRELPLKVSVGAMPDSGKTVAANHSEPAKGKSTKNDGAVELAALGLRLGLMPAPDEGDGMRVVVTAVDDDADAADKGIRPGDFILKVNDADVTTPKEVSKILDRARSEHRNAVLLLIENQEGQRFVPVKLVSA
ncbi:MAG: Do family serine endopeptidase [Rhodospirillales bacterium]